MTEPTPEPTPEPIQPPGPPPPPPPPPGYPGYAAVPYPPGPAYPVAYPYAAVDPYAKSRMTAGLLGIFLGGLGVHRFYLGYTSIGVLQILVTIATCGIGGLWGLTEGIVILSGSGLQRDADGRPLRP